MIISHETNEKYIGTLIGGCMIDKIYDEILNVINDSDEPLETKEIQRRLGGKVRRTNITRTKVFYRLNVLRGEGKIKGKFAGPGKGVWIWWRNSGR